MIMIKNFSIFLIFLHQINAENANPFDECLKEEGAEVLSRGKVCIPKKFIQWIQWNPGAGKGRKTKLSITLSNVQIIEIGSNEITVSMNTMIKWGDKRLMIGVGRALLSEDDQKQIWSPNFGIGNNLMSETKKAEEMKVSFWYKVILRKTYYQITTVRCELNFETYPFDNHICTIEVSKIFSHF